MSQVMVSERALQLLTTWNWDPSILLGTMLVVGGYLAALGPFRSRFESSERTLRSRILWFLLGMGVIFLALVSPLDALSDGYLLSAHMVQHMLLMMIAPPLLLLGTPGWLLRPVLLRPSILPVARFLTSAPVAFLLFNGNLLLWHMPWLYDAALEHEAIHVVEHLSFLATGVVTWWPIFSPLAELPRLSYLSQMAYLMLDMVPAMALGGVILSASTPLYATYAAAPRVFALQGMDDQLLAGLMMTMPVGMLFMGAIPKRKEEPCQN
jgi:cytochrome c oxidase assembly factor CtaG